MPTTSASNSAQAQACTVPTATLPSWSQRRRTQTGSAHELFEQAVKEES